MDITRGDGADARGGRVRVPHPGARGACARARGATAAQSWRDLGHIGQPHLAEPGLDMVDAAVEVTTGVGEVGALGERERGGLALGACLVAERDGGAAWGAVAGSVGRIGCGAIVRVVSCGGCVAVCA